MKTIPSLAASLCRIVCLLLGFLTAFGAPAQNRVLELDGKGSYVQLPPDIFNELTEATVEGWVKWERLGNWMRFFDFGQENQTMLIGNQNTSSTLSFELFDSKRERRGDVNL